MLQASGFRIEAAGPILRQRTERPLPTEQWGSVSGRPYDEGTETSTTSRYALVSPDGVTLREGPATLEKRAWMGTWGGSHSDHVLAVLDGRPAEQDHGTCRWIPESDPAPEAARFTPFILPLSALVEFQSTGVPPRDWTWDADARVLARRLP